MSFLGLNLIAWTAIAALAGVALAAATVVAIITGILTGRADRKRDDAKRAEDRQWDSDRRDEDRERDDRLRREAADEWDRRYRAEQRAREDYEARQVTTEVIPGGQLSQAQRAGLPQSPGHDFNHRIVVSAPVTYPVKWVDVQIVTTPTAMWPSGRQVTQAIRPAAKTGVSTTGSGLKFPASCFSRFPLSGSSTSTEPSTTVSGGTPRGSPRTPSRQAPPLRSTNGSGPVPSRTARRVSTSTVDRREDWPRAQPGKGLTSSLCCTCGTA